MSQANPTYEEVEAFHRRAEADRTGRDRARGTGRGIGVLAFLGGALLTAGALLALDPLDARKSKVVAPPPEPPPAPEQGPWAELDQLMAAVPADQRGTIADEGGGTTERGVEYAYRVYASPPAQEDVAQIPYSIILFYRHYSGWVSWNGADDVWHFKAAGSLETAMEKIQEWVAEN